MTDGTRDTGERAGGGPGRRWMRACDLPRTFTRKCHLKWEMQKNARVPSQAVDCGFTHAATGSQGGGWQVASSKVAFLHSLSSGSVRSVVVVCVVLCTVSLRSIYTMIIVIFYVLPLAYIYNNI